MDAQRQEAERAFRNIAEAYATLSGRTIPPCCSAAAPLPSSKYVLGSLAVLLQAHQSGIGKVLRTQEPGLEPTLHACQSGIQT